jgi:phenylpropionate dioxygenase-like ring-hydroxylating dioxygenase large terminal subunit
MKLRKNQVKGFTRFGEKLMAWRDSEGKLGVFPDKCP